MVRRWLKVIDAMIIYFTIPKHRRHPACVEAFTSLFRSVRSGTEPGQAAREASERCNEEGHRHIGWPRH